MGKGVSRLGVKSPECYLGTDEFERVTIVLTRNEQ